MEQVDIEALPWRKSTWICEHEYIVRLQCPEAFDELAKMIHASKEFDHWKGQRYANLYVGENKYWHMGIIINRKKATLPTASQTPHV